MNYSNLDMRLKTRALSASFLRRLKRIREASLRAVSERAKAKQSPPQGA
jgi:hypothetical protein